MKAVVIFVVTVFLFAGCSSSPSNEEIKLECKKQGKVFKLKEKLVFRTGEYETVAYCD